jgi:hypothetical protein
MPAKKTKEDGILATAAKAIGGAAGSLASLAGVAAGTEAPPAPTRAAKAGRLVKKNKVRLPRKQKKALAKKTAQSS